MTYIKVFWKHEDADFPTLLYSELDDARWEVRKVEVFRTGKMGYASQTKASEETMLGLEPMPVLSEIAKNPVFVPLEIAKDEFEEIWRQAVSN
jgi:Domain of unknown function (DUF6881)